MKCIKNSFWKPPFKSLGEFLEEYLVESLRINFYRQSLVSTWRDFWRNLGKYSEQSTEEYME